VEHRHLLPSEIDLLLDGDAGFGLAPLRAHARRCAHCQGELDAARRVVELLDDLPHFAPSPQFADRVMARVQVFEPWHVTLRDNVRGLVPRSRPARVLAAAGALTTAFVISVAAVALLGRLDVLVFGWQLAADRARAAVVAVLGDALTTVFGDVAVGALARTGTGGVAIAMLGFLASIALAVVLLRALTVAYHRQRS
jgi:hypothetical protein